VVAAGLSNVGIVPTRDQRVVLIDAGVDATGEAILREMTGLGPDAVAAIVLTHGHTDHTAGIARFPQAQIMALGAEVPLVEGQAGSLGPVTRLFPVSPTEVNVTGVLRDGDGGYADPRVRGPGMAIVPSRSGYTTGLDPLTDFARPNE
jgi:glyoxylase-like metal-dependent hydrolase (beta-lactamase superfamily II)